MKAFLITLLILLLVGLAGPILRRMRRGNTNAGTDHSGSDHSPTDHSPTDHSGTDHSGTGHSGTTDPAPVTSPSAAAPETPAGRSTQATLEVAVGDYGPDSAAPLPDGSAPTPEFTVKVNGTSMLYHAPESPYYKRTRAAAWFRTTSDAEAAGFQHWDRRRRNG